MASRASSSCRSAKRLGILFPPAPKWVGAELVAKPAAPASSPVFEHGLHTGDLLGRRRPLVGVVAHDEETECRVAEVGGEVQAEAVPLDRGEVLGEGGEVPGDAGPRAETSISSTFSRVWAIKSRCSGSGGRDGEAAVARHHGGDTVEARRGETRVPEHLGVVVGVDVNEPGCDNVTLRIEHPLAIQRSYRWR